MPVKIETDAAVTLADIEQAAVIAYEAYRQLPPIMMRHLDEMITDHITGNFDGMGAGSFGRGSSFTPVRAWRVLQPMTMNLRRIAKGGTSSIGFRKKARITKAGKVLKKGGLIRRKSTMPKAVRKLYYAKKDPVVQAFSNRGFGWTGRCREAAIAPGKVVGKQNARLTRNFKSKGSATYKRLVWWHYGTTQSASKKQATFFKAVGVPINPGTSLRREARPIFNERIIEQIRSVEADKFVNQMMARAAKAVPLLTKVFGEEFVGGKGSVRSLSTGRSEAVDRIRSLRGD